MSRSPVDPLVSALEGETITRLPQGWRRMVIGAVILSALSFVAAAAMFAALHTQTVKVERLAQENRRNAAETHQALCALRHDLQLRVDGSIRFLEEHPNGVPGIPAKAIRDGIENQQRTISALRHLNCQ